MSRRSTFQAVDFSYFDIGVQSEKVIGDETNHSYAPLEDLLPAMRVKVFIDRSERPTSQGFDDSGRSSSASQNNERTAKYDS
jgi:hypothetical protein